MPPTKLVPLFEAIPFTILEQGEVEEGGQKYMTVRGIAQRADEINGNGRIYPDKILSREVNRLVERLGKGESVFAQADHPSDGVSKVSDTAALVTATEYTPQKEAVTTFKVLKTQKGNDLAEIVRAGGKVGISARGFGSLKRGEVNGVKGDVIQEDYRLVTWDFVIGQSTPGAVVSSFEEQARIGRAEGDEMDISKLTLDDLRKDRPELVAALETELTAKIEAGVAAKIESLVADKTKDIEAKFEAKLAEAAKKNKGKGKMADDDDDDDKDEQMKKLEQLAAAQGLTLVKKESDTAKLEAEVKRLDTMLTETQTNLVESRRQIETLAEGEKTVAIHNYIMEKTKNERFRTSLLSRLEPDGKPVCKTTAEVDKMFETEKAMIERLLTENGVNVTAPTGHAIRTEEPGSPLNEQKVVDIGNGRKITEQEARMRRMAGVK